MCESFFFACVESSKSVLLMFPDAAASCLTSVNIDFMTHGSLFSLCCLFVHVSGSLARVPNRREQALTLTVLMNACCVMFRCGFWSLMFRVTEE